MHGLTWQSMALQRTAVERFAKGPTKFPGQNIFGPRRFLVESWVRQSGAPRARANLPPVKLIAAHEGWSCDAVLVPRLRTERTGELPIGLAGHGGGDARPGAIGWFSPR
jgi:hypothetical protein